MKNKILAMLLIATALLLTACSKDEAGQNVIVEPTPPSAQPLQLKAVTRGGTIDAKMENIKVLMAADDKGTSYYEGSFVKTDKGWDPLVSADAKSYHVYGYMPGDLCKVSLSPLQNSTNGLRSGAVMTLTDLPIATGSNFCVITSVKEAPPTATDPFVIGNYAYDNSSSKNTISLHLDQLFASLVFQMSIGNTRGYSDLRTIKVTKLQIRSKKLAKAVVTFRQALTNAEIPLTDADIQYTYADGKADCPFYDEGGVLNTPDDVIKATCFYVPELYNDLELVTAYDVYDKKDHLVRSSEVANKLPLSSKLQRGQQYTFKLTIEPSYIYQLHDADLDNPDVKIE